MLQLLSGGGLGAVVEDASPQLGGDLDGQSLYDLVNMIDGTFSGSGTFATVNCTNEDDVLQIDADTVFRTGTPANGNLFLGCDSFANDDGQFNVGIGFEAGENNDTTGGGNNGLYNNYIGFQSGKGVTGVTKNTGSLNIALGYRTLYSNTTGGANIVLGYRSLEKNTTGQENFGLGSWALNNNVTGSFNVAIGANALRLSTGISNIGIGWNVLRNVTGSSNTAIGHEGGRALTSGGSNVFIGYRAGKNQTTNSNLLIIDNQDRGSVANEAAMSLIYGVFAAAAADQDLTFNANVFLTQIKSGSDQANAGAAANEIWKTSGHTSLPDNVMMMGV